MESQESTLRRDWSHLRGYWGYQRLNEYPTPDRMAAIRGLMDNHHERQTPTNSPDRLAHPHALYAALIIPLSFTDAYFGHALKARGSMVRHAAMAAQEIDEAREKQNMGFYDSRHYQMGSVLRFYVMPQILEDLDGIEQRSPDVIQRFRQLLPGPDYDFLLPVQEEHRLKDKFLLKELDKFFLSMSRFTLPLLCDAIAERTYLRNPEAVNSYMAKAARQIRNSPVLVNNLPEAYTPRSRRVNIFTDLPEHWTFAAKLDVPVDIPPLRKEDYMRHAAFYNPHDLIIYAKKWKARGAIDIMTVAYGADLRDNPDEPITEDKIHNIATIEFIQSLPPETASLIDARVGTAVTAYDGAVAPVVVDPDITSRENLILSYGEIGEYMGAMPFAMLNLSKEIRAVFENHIDLGPDWEKRNPADALELATRVLWQAIDAEAQGWHSGEDRYIIKDEALARIAGHLTRLEQENPEIWDTIPDFQRANIQINLLNAMVLSPNRFLEYFDQAGIRKILFRKLGKTPNWKECLARMFNKGYPTQTDYLSQILSDHYVLSEQPFINGWHILDDILELSSIYPDETYLERIYRLTSI